ncbi:hypothetical protein [Brucella intermedia]|nr:hypothetical protein [Brucella intermedia]
MRSLGLSLILPRIVIVLIAALLTIAFKTVSADWLARMVTSFPPKE